MTVEAAASAGRGRRRGEVPLVEVEHLKLFFPIKQGILVDREVARVHAVNDVTFSIAEGETLGLVGESGCGKTTMSRAIMRLLDATDGAIRFRGDDITHAPAQADASRCAARCRWSSRTRSRRSTRASAWARSSACRCACTGAPRQEVEPQVRDLLGRVGLHPEHVNRFPHEFSGGQRQRIGVARALALEPRLIVLDEPVSALDVSVQAQIINLLDDLQDDFGLTYLFVAHDLSVVRHVSDRIAVMYLGKLMEVSPAEELYTKPIHPYTSALLAAIPIPDPEENRRRERVVVGGEPPNPIDPPSGLRLPPPLPAAPPTSAARSSRRWPRYPNGHLAACHHPLNVSAEEIARRREGPLEPAVSRRRDAGHERRGALRVRRARRRRGAEHLVHSSRNRLLCTGLCTICLQKLESSARVTRLMHRIRWSSLGIGSEHKS